MRFRFFTDFIKRYTININIFLFEIIIKKQKFLRSLFSLQKILII